jgi:3-methyladenine DNA glycosylase AlkC
MTRPPVLPPAPSAIKAGQPLKHILGETAITALAEHIQTVCPDFQVHAFCRDAQIGLDPLSLMERGRHIASILRHYLPGRYEDAVPILIDSMIPPLEKTEGYGLAVFFYLPHSFFIADYGLDPAFNSGRDPWSASMRGLYELTRRFTAEFAIRPFLIQRTEPMLAQLKPWVNDPDPHVRRLCSEGTRPRLPWGTRLQAFIADPSPTLPLLEALKDDPELYVRRSVANHLGDIAKDHPSLVIDLCRRWLKNASPERRWLIRHALRYPAKKGHADAIALRLASR